MIKVVLTIILLCSFQIYSQGLKQQFNSPEQIKVFADYLFCEKDFLRAADEYQRLLDINKNDTLIFKQGLSFSFMGDYGNAANKFTSLNTESKYYNSSREELSKINFITGNFTNIDSIETEPIKKLEAFSYLIRDEKLPTAEILSSPFRDIEKRNILDFYRKKKEINYKSPVIAGVLSFIIPGAGKIYTGNVSDGLTSFVVTSLLGFIAYDNFRAGHNEKGWIFGSLAFLFHAGNIYGSAAEAQLYNAKANESFNSQVNDYVRSKNYFIQDYGFCK